MHEAVIVSAVRTPTGKFLGALKDFPATALGALVVSEVVRRAGLTPEQATWKDGSGNHSVGQLAYHLVFWNQRELTKFKGDEPSKFSGNNEETFDKFDAKHWSTIVHQLDEVMTEWEKALETADDKKLAAWYSDIAHIGTHNAYHIGQIVFVRKLQGSWDPEKGVK